MGRRLRVQAKSLIMIGFSQEAVKIYKREDDWEHATQMELRRWHTAAEAGKQRHMLKKNLKKAFG